MLRDLSWEYLEVCLAENLFAHYAAQNLHFVVEISISTVFTLGVDTRGAILQHRLQKQTVFSHRLVKNFDPPLDIGKMLAELGSRKLRFKSVKLVCQLGEMFLKFRL